MMVSPRVWIGSKPCLFARSVFDTLIPSSQVSVGTPVRDHHHADRTMVSVHEESNGVISLSSLEDSTGIPMGRARPCSWMDSSPCPTTLVDPSLVSIPNPQARHPFVRLAVVGLILDPTCQHLLITRRPNYMRSFPGAWVFPGGTIHPNETLSQAIQREVYEETGLATSTTNWTMECLWESVYPTTFEKTGDTKCNKNNDQFFVSPDQIQAHHLVIFLSTILSEPSTLKLCPEEVDGAVWLSKDHVSQIIHHRRTKHQQEDPDSNEHLALHTTSAKESQGLTVPLYQLLGIYPQKVTYSNDDTGNPSPTTIVCGMAQGSLFALEEFYNKHWNE